MRDRSSCFAGLLRQSDDWLKLWTCSCLIGQLQVPVRRRIVVGRPLCRRGGADCRDQSAKRLAELSSLVTSPGSWGGVTNRSHGSVQSIFGLRLTMGTERAGGNQRGDP